MNKYLSLVLWIVSFEAVSALIGWMTQPGVDGWYEQLVSPPFTPPNIAFPIVWTFLYALIASAGWVIWRNRNKKLLYLFVAYMALNWGWSFIFFSLHWMAISFLWIIVLDIISIVLIFKAWRLARTASWLLLLPLLWTSFAAYLAGGYWLLN